MRLYAPAHLKVRDPRDGRRIGPEGIEVGDNDFDLLRMQAQGDLVSEAPAPAVDDPAPAAPSPAPAPAPSLSASLSTAVSAVS